MSKIILEEQTNGSENNGGDALRAGFSKREVTRETILCSAQLRKSVKSNLLSFYRLLQANFHMEAFLTIPCFKLNLNFCSTLFY